MQKNSIIFNIAGGVGKNILATAVVRKLKKDFPDKEIIVSSPWEIVWRNNPDVNKIISIEHTPNFYNEYIRGKNSKIIFLDPYSSTDYFYQRKHLAEIWSDLCDITTTDLEPLLYFTDEEKKSVQAKLASINPTGKPFFFIQSSGGAINQTYPISWARDLPISIAEEITEVMNQKGYLSLQFRRENQIALKGTVWLPLDQREAMCAILFSDKRLFVDSFAAHAAAALKKPSVVTWVINSPKVFGHKIHKNIETKSQTVFRHRIDSYLEPYNISGIWHEHPYETDIIFDSEEIINLILQDPPKN